MNTRVVNVHADTYLLKEEVPFDEVERAVGYLSTWNQSGFTRVDIYSDGPTDMAAVYSNPGDNERRYVIGAVWHEGEEGGHYGFHS